MSWKDELAREIMHAEEYSLSDPDYIKKLSVRFPKIRFKTIDSQGSVYVIKLDEKSEWLKPIDWANIHLCNLRQRLHDDVERLLFFEAPTDITKALNVEFPGLFDDFDQLAQKYSSLLDEYNKRFRNVEAQILELREDKEEALARCLDLEERIVKANDILKENINFATPLAIKQLIGNI